MSCPLAVDFHAGLGIEETEDGFKIIIRCPVKAVKATLPAAKSGRIEARIGLRMMPTFPRSPLSFRTAGFPSVRLEGWLSEQCLPG
jgi:hypothetical protein